MAGYIGVQPVPQATQNRSSFTATANQATFATEGYTVGFIDVYKNGLKLAAGSDFTATNGSDVVLTSGASANDVIEVISFVPFEVSDFSSINTGVFNIRNSGSQSELRLFCESNNAHYASIKAPAHSSFSGNITLDLPSTTGTLLSTTNSDAPTTTTSSSDADFVLIDDGGIMKKITPANLGVGSGSGGGSSVFTSQTWGASLSGKLGLVAGTDNIIIAGTSEPTPNLNTSTGTRNTVLGFDALHHVTDGDQNVAIGDRAGYGIGSSSSYNTFVGSIAGYDSTSPGSSSSDSQNTVIGYYAMVNNGGSGRTNNTIVGAYAGGNMTTGDYNTLLGYEAETYYTNSYSNVAVGYYAKVGWRQNVSIGYQAGNSMYNQTDNSVLIGYRAGYDMDGGDNVIYIGYQAGYGGGSASHNIGIGFRASYSMSSGFQNVGIGSYANYYINSGDNNVGVGYDAGSRVRSGNNNTSVGYRALYNNGGTNYYTGSNSMCLGNGANPSSSSVSNEITLGDSSITALRCQVTSITALSDERDKTAIEDLDLGLNFIKAMKPRKFTWNRRDGKWEGKKEIGFIAQELHEVEMDFSSTTRTRLVSYENPSRLEAQPMNTYPILVKAVQELSAKVDSLQAEITKLKGE
tara:strand:+ start:6962 stop:8857 length:1896 start_codon:yes stop_codon:yes gene_type:complete